MKGYHVYIHTTPDGKKYVGCTTLEPEVRWGEGKGYNSVFRDAIFKYGWDNVTHEVFEVDSLEEMYRKEIELISFYHSNDPRHGYNLQEGGIGGKGFSRKQPKYRVKLPDGKIRVMGKSKAFSYCSNYYSRYPWKKRKGPLFLEEILP